MKYVIKNIVKDSKEFKIDKMVEFFTDPNRIDVTDLNYASSIKLNNMIIIYYSKEDLLNKYYNMKEIFKTSNDFIKEYSFLKDYVNDVKVNYIFGYVNEIAKFFSSIEKGLSKEREKELLLCEKENYFDDYPYAEYYVNKFIEYNESPYLKDFLIKEGLYEQDFNRFLSILLSFDDELYDKYVEKEKENKLLRKVDVVRKIENIKSGIVTGYTKDGEVFDNLEFYSNLPFKDQESSRVVLEDFELKKLSTLDQKLRTLIENLCHDDVNQIMNYIYKNNLIFAKAKNISEDEIKKSNYILNGKELTEEGKEEIIKYMQVMNIPFLSPAFNIVKNKYMNNELKPIQEKSLQKVANK